MAAASLDLPKLDAAGWNWTFNATAYVPSARDLALAGPRMFMRLGALFAIPDFVDPLLGGVRLGAGQRVIPAATGHLATVDPVTTAATGAGQIGRAAVGDTIQAGAQISTNAGDTAEAFGTRFTMESVRSLGNVFSYATSRWALGCIAVAVLLNRTSVYASTRHHLVLGWKVRLLVRLLPVLLLGMQCRELLQSIQCQTSPDFAMLRWGNASRTSELMFTQNGGFLHDMSRTLLLGAGDADSCVAVGMIEPEYDGDDGRERTRPELKGSLGLLWPMFQTFAFSQFVETLSCAVAGRPVAGETGMTLFEHSLAFAEADAGIGNQLGWGPFGIVSKEGGRSSNSTVTVDGTTIAITRSMIMKRVNTAPEVLLIGFLSSMNHLTSHLLAIFNSQGRFRLINTGIWGLAFMAAIASSIWSFSMDDFPNQSLLRFPTVSVVGFIPHVLVLTGIIGCSLIYAVALLLSALALPAVEDAQFADEDTPPASSTFWRRAVAAHRNMQANVPLANIRITLYMDFYTALLRTGFAIMTMASEAAYLHESRGVNIKLHTWLEEDRLREIEAIGAQWLSPTFRLNDPDSSLADGSMENVGLVPAQNAPMDLLQHSTSGYAREMITRDASTLRPGRERGAHGANGVGVTERGGRWIMAMEFFLGINRLLLSCWATLVLKLMARAGIQSRPRWLLWLVTMPKTNVATPSRVERRSPETPNFWLVGADGELSLPKDEHVDVEVEFRNNMRQIDPLDGSGEEALDSKLYSWFVNGGWWGVDDSSGSFQPAPTELDEDTTSMVSFSTNASHDERAWESDDGDDDGAHDDGRRTPTQQHPSFSRESTPLLDTPLDPSDLARLLHPQTPEQRAEAQALSAHLKSEGIVTRSRFRNMMQRERAKVLISTPQHRPANFTASSPSGKLTPEEETLILEHLIVSRRADGSSSSSSTPARGGGGAGGLGDGGPQCVVCKSAPRSIIVWPCRCLSLCDDCRVTLAMNNFDRCVCCRHDIGSFSRVFVP